RVPSVGASFALGRLQIFEGVSKGNAMLNLQGNFRSPTTEQAVRRNITHELGHSIVEQGMNQANRQGIDPDIMSDYKFAAGWFKGPLAGDPEMLYDAGDVAVQAAVINRTTLPIDKRIFPNNVGKPWKERPLTGYGADNPGDDFAEAFMAYVNEPDVLK